MTDEMMSLRGLLEKGADADLLREMIGFAAERPMELDVGGLTGAAHGEKSAERLVQRNGYGEQDWQTRAGTVELRIRTLGPLCWWIFRTKTHTRSPQHWSCTAKSSSQNSNLFAFLL